jgi:hypothetical protein
MSDPVLRQGDVVTCENGHEVCTVRADLFPETLNWGSYFVNWRQHEPVTGDPTPLWCAICGAAYMVQTIEDEGDLLNRPMHAYIQGQGWVPPIPEDMGPVPKAGEL